MEKNNIHKNHRQRVRNNYLKNGIGNMEDYKILELLLFFGIPYKDTNEIAHKLTESFSNLNGVLDAPIEELEKIDGIGENAAVLIKLVHDLVIKYNTNKTEPKANISTHSSISDFLAMKFMGETREIVYLVSIDNRGRLEKCIKVGEGSKSSMTFDRKDIIKTALVNEMTTVIMAHNHPTGFAVPSAADVMTTKELIPIFKDIGIEFIDHIIIAEDGSYSMAYSKKYGSLFL